MTRKVCENNIESQSQPKGCVKNLVIGFPDTPVKVTDWEEGGPRLKRKIEYVATISNRKLALWPPAVRMTWSFCGVIVKGAKVGSSRPLQS